MPLIKFIKNRPPIEVEPQAQLMKSLLDAGLPVASSCLGDGVCAKCRIRIVEGAPNLSPQNTREQILRERHKIPPEVRISCQAFVNGDITVDADYW